MDNKKIDMQCIIELCQNFNLSQLREYLTVSLDSKTILKHLFCCLSLVLYFGLILAPKRLKWWFLNFDLLGARMRPKFKTNVKLDRKTIKTLLESRESVVWARNSSNHPKSQKIEIVVYKGFLTFLSKFQCIVSSRILNGFQ